MTPGAKWSSGSCSQQGPEHKKTPPLLSEMQKTTYYDNSSTLFGGYSSYQVQGGAAAAANGFGGYDAPVPVSHHQPAFQSAAHLDVDSYQRSACSLQSLASTNSHQQQQQQQQLAKTKELNGSCMRSSLPPEHHPSSQVSPPLPPNPSNGNNGAQQPGGSAGTSSKSGSNKSSTSSSSISSSTSSSSSSLPPNPTLAKQIFPWMKECRQATKQKTCSPSNNSGNGVFDYTHLLSLHPPSPLSVTPSTSVPPLPISLWLPPYFSLHFPFSLASLFLLSHLLDPIATSLFFSTPVLSPSAFKTRIPGGFRGFSLTIMLNQVFTRHWCKQGNEQQKNSLSSLQW